MTHFVLVGLYNVQVLQLVFYVVYDFSTDEEKEEEQEVIRSCGKAEVLAQRSIV